MKLRALIALFFPALAALPAFASGPGKANDFEGRRALIIGIDGCRTDALRKVIDAGLAPNLKALADGGTVTWSAFAGGELGGVTQQATSSGPGWATVLGGVYRDKHHVADNKFAGHRLVEFPPFLRRVKELRPSAWCFSVCEWAPINDQIMDGSMVNGAGFLDLKFTADADEKSTEKTRLKGDDAVREHAVAALREHDPDVGFIHFGDVDHAGHAFKSGGKFSPDNQQYLDTIHVTDGYVGDVLSAMRARPKFADENWLVVVTTDHGGRNSSHGGQSPEERSTWLIVNGGAAPRGRVLEKAVGQAVVPPTVMRHLGLAVDPAWGWESGSFALP